MINQTVNVPSTLPIASMPDVDVTPRFGHLFSGDIAKLILWLDHKPLTVSFMHHVILGRAHKRATNPEIVDLSSYDALLQGVSRQHVEITRQGTLLYVEDLGSTNGTLLNGKPLTPSQPRILRDGDRLHLGFLPIHVQFQDSEFGEDR